MSARLPQCPTIAGISVYCWNGGHDLCPIPESCMCSDGSLPRRKDPACSHRLNDFFFNRAKPTPTTPPMPEAEVMV